MAASIKGIKLVIEGETTGLQKALSDVNRKSEDLQYELNKVERLLKLDPTNTELLAQKQKILAEAVSNSSEKLTRLKNAQEQVENQFKKGDISEGQYRAFQREIVYAEQELTKFETKLQETGTTAKKTGTDLQAVGDKLKGIGGGLSAGVTAPLVAGLALATEGTREFRMDLSRLDTNAKVAGQSTDILSDAMAKLYAVTGETDSNVEGLSELLATGFRDEQLTELLNSMYGASIKFADTLKFEGISDGLQETLATGAAIGPFSELLERSGIVLDDFNAGLKDAIANGTQEQYVLDVLAKTGLADTYEAYRKNNKELNAAGEAQYRLQKATAELGNTLEPIVTAITKKITELVNWFNELPPTGQNVVLVIAAIAAVIGPLLLLIASLTIALPALGAAFTFATGPIGLIIVTIAALIAAGVALYKNWDKVKAWTIQSWEGIEVAILKIITAIMGYMEKLYGWIPKIGGAVKTAAAFARQALEEETKNMEKARANFIKLQESMAGGGGSYGGRGPEESFDIPAISDITSNLEGLGGAADTAGVKATKAAEDTRAEWEKTSDILGTRLQLIKTQQENAALAADQHGDKAKGLAEQIVWLNKQHETQLQIVEAVNIGYQESVQAKGEDAEETLKLAVRLEQEKKAQAEIEKQIRETNQAIKDQAEELQDLADEITKVEKKYNEDMASALDDYQKKVAETNKRVAEEERKLTEQYEKELDNRTRSLVNFVGLFDEVAQKEVSGEALLQNLQGQVSAFEDWSKNISELAARGVDNGLIEELREMGPKAGPEIAALNTLTDEQLQEYVSLWRTKNEEAREEAVNQLEQQRVEMQQKLIEIQNEAAEQLELYRKEWEKKNAEIRKNTEEELKKIAEKFNEAAEKGTTYGVKLIMNYVAGIESGFEALRAAIEEAQSIAGEIDPTVRHSPSLVDRVQTGTAEIYKAYETLMNDMRGLELGANLSLQAAAGGSSSYSSVNHISITVQDGEDLLRTLHRLGVAIP